MQFGKKMRCKFTWQTIQGQLLIFPWSFRAWTTLNFFMTHFALYRRALGLSVDEDSIRELLEDYIDQLANMPKADQLVAIYSAELQSGDRERAYAKYLECESSVIHYSSDTVQLKLIANAMKWLLLRKTCPSKESRKLLERLASKAWISGRLPILCRPGWAT